MKKARFYVRCDNVNAYVPFNTLREIRQYVHDNQSEFCNFENRFVYTSGGERVYVIHVRMHPILGFVRRVILSPRVY